MITLHAVNKYRCYASVLVRIQSTSIMGNIGTVLFYRAFSELYLLNIIFPSQIAYRSN